MFSGIAHSILAHSVAEYEVDSLFCGYVLLYAKIVGQADSLVVNYQSP